MFSEKDLEKKGYIKQEDGTYSKQSNGSSSNKRTGPEKTQTDEVGELPLDFQGECESTDRRGDTVLDGSSEGCKEEKDISHIELRLFGKPMAKQSVRQGRNGRFFQPKKYHDRIADYQEQIRNQLPDGFKMFEQEVVIEEFTVIFPPLKGFKKSQMEKINRGEFIPKLTRPDLPDNLKKLPFDSMSGIVFKDDSLIWKELNTSKVYGTGGCIIIKLRGK